MKGFKFIHKFIYTRWRLKMLAENEIMNRKEQLNEQKGVNGRDWQEATSSLCKRLWS